MSLFMEKSELCSAMINELQAFESIFQLLCLNCSRIIVIITQDFLSLFLNRTLSVILSSLWVKWHINCMCIKLLYLVC